jgi:hypothetical protein
MIVKVGSLTFGWGAEVRSLPDNKDAYGAFVMSREVEKDLVRAIELAGWKPSWRVQPTERVVFLCDPKAKEPWRQSVTASMMKGQTMQVVEVP